VDKDDASGLTIVDEIKTSALDFSELSDDALGRYWAQAAVYGHFLCTARQLDRIILQLTYYQTTTKQITRQQWPLPAADLAEYYQALLHDYAGWVIFRHQLKQERDASLTPLTFPFGDFRPQQREFAAAGVQDDPYPAAVVCSSPHGHRQNHGDAVPRREGDAR
jgi:hypothetical protein